MDFRHFVRRLRWSTRLNGYVGLMGAVSVRVRRRLLRREPDDAFYVARDRYFDQRFGVQTAGCVEVDDMADVAKEDRANMVEYRPTPAVDLAMAISNALTLWDAKTVSRATFLDLGCGKGRGLLVAGQFPFAAAVGVEMCSSIANAAERNLAAARVAPRCDSIQVIHGNALDTSFPDGPIFLYMFNPFHEPIVQAIENRLSESVRLNPRPVIVLYANAQHADLFRGSKTWQERPVDDDWWAVFESSASAPGGLREQEGEKDVPTN